LICNRETIVYLIAVIKQCTESAKYIKCMSTLLHDWVACMLSWC
jgi:hypothetical protein